MPWVSWPAAPPPDWSVSDPVAVAPTPAAPVAPSGPRVSAWDRPGGVVMVLSDVGAWSWRLDAWYYLDRWVRVVADGQWVETPGPEEPMREAPTGGRLGWDIVVAPKLGDHVVTMPEKDLIEVIGDWARNQSVLGVVPEIQRSGSGQGPRYSSSRRKVSGAPKIVLLPSTEQAVEKFFAGSAAEARASQRVLELEEHLRVLREDLFSARATIDRHRKYRSDAERDQEALRAKNKKLEDSVESLLGQLYMLRLHNAELEERAASAGLTRKEVLGLLHYVHPDVAPDDARALELAQRLTALLPNASR